MMNRLSVDEKRHRTHGDDESKGVLTTDAAHELSERKTSVVTKDGVVVNASGHRDQLQRQYSLLSICGLALTIDNAWVALGGSLTVSIRKCYRLRLEGLCSPND